MFKMILGVFLLILITVLSYVIADELNKTYYFELGKEAYLSGNYISARDNLVQALLLDTTDTETKKYLELTLTDINKIIDKLTEEAKNYKKMGLYINSIDKLYNILEWDPENTYAKSELNELQIQLEKLLKDGTYISPKEKYTIESFIEYNKNQYTKAVSLWEKVLTIDSSIGNKKFLLGDHIIKKYLEKVNNILLKMENEKQINELITKGITAYNNKKYYESKIFFNDVIKLSSENITAKEYINKCDNEIARIESEKEEKRIKKLSIVKEQETKKQEIKKQEDEYPKETKRVDSQDIDKIYQQGLIYFASGQLESALKEFELVLRLNPKHRKAKQAAEKIRKELQLSVR